MIILLMIISSASAIDYFTDRMNFPPGESRLHNQTLANDGVSAVIINATIPSGFNLSSTDCSQINSSLVSCSIPASSTKYFTITSPNDCTEGTINKSYLTGTNFSEEFTFVCIPDNKITDCKIEYGHGDANYLSDDQLYISNEPASIFNLLRIWNIGHYLTPDEAAQNATIICQYELYPVRTYGRVEIDYGSKINGTFLWDLIENGYWFRIGVVSQDISGKSVGDYYNKTCSNLTYQFEHHQVIASPSNCNLEIRDPEPFSCSISQHPNFLSRSILTITNSEKYDVYDISFDRLLNDIRYTETYRQLNSGNSIYYIIDNTTEFNTSIFYIPSWYINSRNPKYYKQELSCTPSTVNNPPSLVQNIPNQTWNMNINNTDAFGLDNYFIDIDADSLTYTYTPIANITVVINSSTNQVSFIPDFNWYGTRNITFYANDSINTTPSNLVILNVTPCGNSIVDSGEQCDNTNLSGQTCIGLGYAGGSLSCTALCTFDTSACTSSAPSGGGGGGGGGGRPSAPIVEEIEEEPVKEISLTIVDYPENIDLEEREFTVFAVVENTGELLLEDVRLEIGDIEGWSAETISLGDLGIGESKSVQIKFVNEICSSEFVIMPRLDIKLTAKEVEVQDDKDISIDINIPELSVSTDRTEYSEGDVLRLCIIYNNIGKDQKEKIEFEANFMYNEEEHYIIDYLSPYSVNSDKILIVTRDYVLENVPITSDYTIGVKMFLKGDLFSQNYSIAEADTVIFLNGLIEDTILQREDSVYEFKHNNMQHTVIINEVNDNYVDVSVFSSSPQNVRIKLLETVYLDLDEDNENDISLTYMGIKDGKADIRIKILPKQPKVPVKAVDSYEVGLGEKTPTLEKPEAIAEETIWERFKEFFVKNLFRLVVISVSVIIVIVIFDVLFYFSPASHKFAVQTKDKAAGSLKNLSDKFLNNKRISKGKKR
ncbi:hypothetical protein KY343_03320 [Candidatus Woesearchaeota archaeon]|nr:hypothetical protein [Candidatus Woesearchaeota archaeon]